MLSPPRDSRVVSAQHLGDLQLIAPVDFVCELAICFQFTTKIMLNMLCSAFQYSQLSSNQLPMVHDKVVAYMGKKKKNISNFCPKKRLWSFKKFK